MDKDFILTNEEIRQVIKEGKEKTNKIVRHQQPPTNTLDPNQIDWKKEQKDLVNDIESGKLVLDTIQDKIIDMPDSISIEVKQSRLKKKIFIGYDNLLKGKKEMFSDVFKYLYVELHEVKKELIRLNKVIVHLKEKQSNLDEEKMYDEQIEAQDQEYMEYMDK